MLLGFFAVATFLIFYNLEYNPRSWHDEGSALSLAKTLATDGVYAVRTSAGYQTFGPVQSVGPTVLLPIALSFKLSGIGLAQGRIVMAGFALLTLVIFYRCGVELFGRRVALISAVLLLSSSNVGFLLFGRQALGEIPALGFFLAGWLAWVRGLRTERWWLHLMAGLLIGAAMVTKTQYAPMGFGTLALLAMLDLVYYRQGNWRNLVVIGVIAFVCIVAWWGWQVIYFGMETFQENAGKLRQLADSTTGFHLHTTINALQSLFGASAPVYFFWILPAPLYAGFLGSKRNQDSSMLMFLLLFSCLWLGYYIFWIIPWQRYAFPPLAVMALFVGKLYKDLAAGFISSNLNLRYDLNHFRLAGSFSPQALVSLGTLIALITLALLTLNQLQKIIRTDVLDTVGQETVVLRSVPQLDSPHQVAAFIKQTIPKDAVIETWERELDILTDHRYHFPDQALLAQADLAIYHNGDWDYTLGADYFASIRPAYVIVGFYAKFNQIYDTDYLRKHGQLIATIGQDPWGYDVYKLSLTPSRQEQGRSVR
jgi:4-amino-4-deoxy-L-arabinose transferase-like glycosyltransferase